MNDTNGGLKGLVMGQIDSGSTAAGERVLKTAASLKRIAVELRSDEIGRNAAPLADRGVERLERLGTYLSASDGEHLVMDAERLGRDRPWTVATSGLILGFIGSRMLKASAARRHSTTDNSTYTDRT